jgi:hypothetical protein
MKIIALAAPFIDIISTIDYVRSTSTCTVMYVLLMAPIRRPEREPQFLPQSPHLAQILPGRQRRWQTHNKETQS